MFTYGRQRRRIKRGRRRPKNYAIVRPNSLSAPETLSRSATGRMDECGMLQHCVVCGVCVVRGANSRVGRTSRPILSESPRGGGGGNWGGGGQRDGRTHKMSVRTSDLLFDVIYCCFAFPERCYPLYPIKRNTVTAMARIIPEILHLGWCRSTSLVCAWGETETADCLEHRVTADKHTAFVM